MTKTFCAASKNSYFQNSLRILRTKKILIFGITLLGFSLTALILQNVKPIYRASAQIIFENKNPTFIETQRLLIRSPHIVLPVIYDLNLMNDPDFNSKIKAEQKKSKFKAIDIYKAKTDILSNEIIAKELEPVISNLQKNIFAQVNPDSYVLNLEYNGYNPQKAGIILNSIIKHYIEYIDNNTAPEPTKIIEKKETKNNYEAKILKQLSNNAKLAQENIEKLKKLIEETKPYKYGYNKKLYKDYERAKLKYAAAKAKLKPFLDENGEITVNEKAARSLNSDIIEKLRLKHHTLTQELKAFSVIYGDMHPKLRSLTSQISIIEKQIEQEKINIISRLKAKYNQTQAQLKSLEKSIDKNNANDNNEFDNAVMQAKLKMLRKHAQETKRMYKEYEALYNKLIEKQKNRSNNIKAKKPVELVSKVIVSDTPIFPDKVKILTAGTILSLIIAILLALFTDRTKNRFLSARQLEEYLNIPCLALIPSAQSHKDKPLAHYVIDEPASTTSEAVRSLKLVIKLFANAKNKKHKVITLTSSLPNEGKTTLSSWIAQLAAKSGDKVILIDADLRKPGIHKIFGTKNTLSLVEYLSGQNKLEEIIDTSLPSGLHIIYGRSVPNSALDLVSSDKMENLITSLRKAYDLVIIDSPACMAVSDARALEKLSDQLLYVVLWNKTPRKIIHNGISQFTKFGKSCISTVLMNIDLKKHVELGYGESINRYGRY